MNDISMKVLQNRPLTADVRELILQGDTAEITRPGQFVNLKLDGCYLRRPISVCDLNADRLTLIYKVVGRGTGLLAETPAGETLSVLTGLGNGYDLSLAGDAPLLLGGGVGVPPLYLLAKRMLGLPAKTVEEGVESYAKACGELGKRLGIVMNFKGQGLDEKEYLANVEKLAYLAYEDQCSPVNPRVPLVEDMKKILTDAYYTEEFVEKN